MQVLILKEQNTYTSLKIQAYTEELQISSYKLRIKSLHKSEYVKTRSPSSLHIRQLQLQWHCQLTSVQLPWPDGLEGQQLLHQPGERKVLEM